MMRFAAAHPWHSYRRLIRWIFVGITALFGTVAIFSAMSAHHCMVIVLGLTILVVVATVSIVWRWDRSFSLIVLAIVCLMGLVLWVVGIAHHVGASIAFGAFPVMAFAILRVRPWWCAAAAALIMLWVGAAIGVALAAAPEEQIWSIGLKGTIFLGTVIIPFAALDISWWVFRQQEQFRKEQESHALAQERLRFATDLHDIQGHTLLTIAWKAELARKTLNKDTATVQRELHAIEQLARDASDQTREIAHGYHTTTLAAEIANCVELLAAAGIKVSVIGKRVYSFPWENLFAIAIREAATNILHHATPRQVTIELQSEAIAVTNDGVREHSSSRAGTGLSGLQRRFAEYDGVVRGKRHKNTFTMLAATHNYQHGAEQA